MNDVRQAVHEVIERRILPWIERDGISRLFLPEQFTSDVCVRTKRCMRPTNPGHREHSFTIGLAGKVPYCIDKKEFVFSPGRIVLLPSGIVHTAVQTYWWRTAYLDPNRAPSTLGLTVYPFGVRVQILHLLPREDAVEISRPYVLLGNRFSVLITALLEELRFKPPQYAFLGKSLLMEFMVGCLRARSAGTKIDAVFISSRIRSRLPKLSFPKSEVKTASGRGRSGKKASRRIPMSVQAAREFIFSHYNLRINLEDIAEAADTSATHLRRQFKSVTGQTPIEYLLKVRMAAARELLLTDLKVYEVARLVGIEDFCYFSRLFRRVNGVSPTQYRERMSKAEALHAPLRNWK